MTLRCKACGGTYVDLSADGVPYFHACPRQIILVVELASAALVERTVPALRGLIVCSSDRERADLLAAGVDAQTIGVVRDRRAVRRADHRDEHTRTRDGAHGETRVIKSEGAGVDVVAGVARGA